MEDVTGWVVSQQRTEYGGNNWIGAAVRILREVDETKTNKYHLVAQYSYYSFSNTINQNLLIYKKDLNTQNDYVSERIIIYGSGIKGTIIEKDLGWFGPSTSVSSGDFNCKWNRDSSAGGGTFYSYDVQATYKTPSDSSGEPLPLIDNVIEKGSGDWNNGTIQYIYTKWESGLLEYSIRYSHLINYAGNTQVGHVGIWGNSKLYLPVASLSENYYGDAPKFIDIPILSLCQIFYNGVPHNVRPYIDISKTTADSVNYASNGCVCMRYWWTHTPYSNFNAVSTFKLVGHWK